MASVLSIRRPIAALAAQSYPHAAVTALLSSPTSPRSFSTTPRPQTARLALASSNIQQYLSHRQQTARRLNHYTTKPPRSWKFEDKLILVDVREPAELTSTGIIPTAVAVPLASQPDALFLTPDEFETRFGYPKPGIEEEGDIIFYCKAGVRAKTAAQLAVQAGYNPDRIGVYEGSWLDWADKGGEWRSGRGPNMSRVCDLSTKLRLTMTDAIAM
ncbi:rhodanese-like domain-containing protein [Aspergillus novofumigatus IBT 16806]|uniref:Rhodanese domain protein n=1 Tax=Aspergillus novofumigatus (strain IBT 16806) TaxID=1392255 RepID=A0A2I1BW87_ASPN1|nr:Rhodanese domain protein [Aspergillus novofumigatus IBT 16806]PKX89561.1 Rhodanese domain protein [Aspergillus novofumigatus IBT 16806]